MPILPEWNPPKKKSVSNAGYSDDSEPHDDPAPMDAVEDEDNDVSNDGRRAPANDDQRDPDDDDEGVWSEQ